ncbi:hypothetical protein SAMN04487895_101631 [Paenibacillus sophorae]|uniref:Uncharacterized protein n=1 Tax=Paenibacillus sophorae TaxID=1333845 RepID=A0A1H8GSN3_9BACL|nr:hypothetical protein [Paenibacillus sophorae]QWU14328.1 hypothetical protein KP014_20695 [Paenibacillus sophorae]SEN47013.1 hypothetical protein SAMN04487895_101631 [Paenibacillus sophorae]
MSVNLDIFKELLMDYEDDVLTYSDMIEFRDKLKDIKDDVERKMDQYEAD